MRFIIRMPAFFFPLRHKAHNYSTIKSTPPNIWPELENLNKIKIHMN